MTLPQAYELWLAERVNDVVVAGRVVGWDPRPDTQLVPIVAWSDGTGQLLHVGPPDADRLWLANTREAAVDGAQDRHPGDDAPRVV